MYTYVIVTEHKRNKIKPVYYKDSPQNPMGLASGGRGHSLRRAALARHEARPARSGRQHSGPAGTGRALTERQGCWGKLTTCPAEDNVGTTRGLGNAFPSLSPLSVDIQNAQESREEGWSWKRGACLLGGGCLRHGLDARCLLRGTDCLPDPGTWAPLE